MSFQKLSASLACLGLLIPISAAAFTDVQTGSDHGTAIVWAEKQQIVAGYKDGTFRPQKTINRAEFTKIILNAMGASPVGPDCASGHTTFPDVPADAWFAPFVCEAKARQIVDGNPDGTFRPNDPVNLVEAAKMIVKAFKYDTSAYSTSYANPTKSGETESAWFRPFIESLLSKNAIPMDINTFESSIIRGQLVEMLYRLQNKITNEKSPIFESLQMNGFEYGNPPLFPFDACNNIESYKKMPWFPEVQKRLDADGTDIAESCLSQDYYIVLAASQEKAALHIYRYNIALKKLEEATRLDDFLCNMTASAFGKRSYDLIPLLNKTTIVGQYDASNNTIRSNGVSCW